VAFKRLNKQALHLPLLQIRVILKVWLLRDKS